MTKTLLYTNFLTFLLKAYLKYHNTVTRNTGNIDFQLDLHIEPLRNVRAGTLDHS